MKGDLTETFRRLIRLGGPLSLSRYMGESNARYYAARDPLGSAGDFVTAPEISQMFGELVGLWLADLWVRAGKPDRVAYAELGPGRGTLAKDALRAMAAHGLQPEVHFVEGSPALRDIQDATGLQAHLHDDATTLPVDMPLLIVANEFFDALPIRQLVRNETGWRERMVGLGDDGSFRFVAGDQPMDAIVPAPMRDAPADTIIETCPAATAIMRELGTRLAAQGGAALVIDYGYGAPQTGSTLQAVRAHEKVDPLEAPGTADLTAHVDFAALAQVAEAAGARIDGAATQGGWLRAMGIEARAEALAKASPAEASAIAAAMDRLVSPQEMGKLFKALAIVSPGWPVGAGFAPSGLRSA